MKSEQTQFWEGPFGADYTKRNDINYQDRIPFFTTVLSKVSKVKSICELGANKGHNLQALNEIDNDLELVGVEVNKQACDILKQDKNIEGILSSIQDFEPKKSYDLVFTAGVLIHLSPNELDSVYSKIFNLSHKYILINEYFNPRPVELKYRNHLDKLFKRDFGGEFLDKFSKNIELVDYGFLWGKVEKSWDNTTWWLFKKK